MTKFPNYHKRDMNPNSSLPLRFLYPPRPTFSILVLARLGEILQQELREGALVVHQLLIGASFGDPAVFQHSDDVRMGQVRDAVGD